MSKNTIDNFPKPDTTHSVMIGGPLVIVLAFAFGFVLLQPVSSANSRLTSASQTASSKASSSKSSVTASFTPAPIPQASLPTLALAPITSDSSLDGTADSTVTTTPQSVAGSASSPATSSSGLQSAIPNHQSIGSKPISTKSNSPGSILTNLFNHL